MKFFEFEVTQTTSNGETEVEYFCCSCRERFDNIGEMGKHLQETIISQDILLSKEPKEIHKKLATSSNRVYQNVLKNKKSIFFRYIDSCRDVTEGEKLEKVGVLFGIKKRTNKERCPLKRKWTSINFRKKIFGCRSCSEMYYIEPSEYEKVDKNGKVIPSIGNL